MLYWCKYVDSLGALQGSMSSGTATATLPCRGRAVRCDINFNSAVEMTMEYESEMRTCN